MKTLLGIIVGGFIGGHGGRALGVSTRGNIATWLGGAVLGGVLGYRSSKKTGLSGLRRKRRR